MSYCRGLIPYTNDTNTTFKISLAQAAQMKHFTADIE